MKNRKLKAFVSVILSGILIYTCVLPAFAEDREAIATSDEACEVTNDEVFDECVINSIIEPEQKYICKATLDDDFEDDSVIVQFTNEASLKFKEYTTDDFKNLGVASIIRSDIDKKMESKVLVNIDEINEKFQLSQQINQEKLNFLNNVYDCSRVFSTTVDKNEIEKNSELISFDKELEQKIEYINEYNQAILIKLNVHSKQGVLNAIKELEKREDVMIAQPNYLYEVDSVPNDTLISKQWAVNKINLPSAWNITTGNKNVKVGIIDTGIKRAHSDLTANVSGTLKIAGSDLIDPLTDENGHGTNVAGIIGAVGNNSKGVTGSNWNVTMVSLKAKNDVSNLDNNILSSFAVCDCIKYAIDNNIDILNCSYGSGEYKSYEYSKMKDFKGLIVCAAGNENKNNDTLSHYPANYDLDNIISIAAVDKNDNLAYFSEDSQGNIKASNYGKTTVDLAAPGTDILTTNNSNNSSLYYTAEQGTSFAAPYVSGVAALIKSLYPTMTANGLKKAILDGVDKVSSLSGKVSSGGRLNAYKALLSAREHKFTVVYNKNGGTGTTMSNTQVTYGVPTQLKANSYTHSDSHKTFAGWYAHRNSDNKWLYTNGNATGWYVEGSQPTGYKKSLYKDQSIISATTYAKNDTVTMYAQWRQNQYTIEYISNGGVGTMDKQTVGYLDNVALRSNTFKKTGYSFKGWYAKRKSDSKVLYSNGTVRNWYTKNSQPSGYDLCLLGNGTTLSTLSELEGDVITMVAQWTPLSYIIKFAKNGANGGTAMQNIIAYSNEVVRLPAHTFTREGYCFNGWYVTDEDGWCYCTNGDLFKWISSDAIPNDYHKVLIENKSDFTYLADYDNIILTFRAQWRSKDSILLGDVDLNGVIDVKDVTLIQKYIAELEELNDVQLYAADVNKDGNVSILDCTAIYDIINS